MLVLVYYELTLKMGIGEALKCPPKGKKTKLISLTGPLLHLKFPAFKLLLQIKALSIAPIKR